MELLENLNWRYATKRFIPSKTVSVDDLEKLKEAIRLSASSYGLQLYKIFIVSNSELKERLRPASWDQRQITECSHLFVFCNYVDVQAQDIDELITLQGEIRSIDPGNLQGYADFMKGKLLEKSTQEKTNWLQKQPYLALANLLIACAELKIDACPIEGFDPDQYNEILKLQDKRLNAVVIAAIGYRSGEDPDQFVRKIRKPTSLLFEQI